MSKFGELIDAQVPVLIDFFTEWNEPSVAMNGVIRHVAAALGDYRDWETDRKSTRLNSSH